MNELINYELVPVASRLMEDTKFQDWLLRVELMVRSEDWQEVQPVWKNGGTDEILSPIERDVMDKLLTNRGYIVAHTQIAPLDSKDCTHYSRTYVNRIRSKLQNPMLIFSTPHLGFGYGVGIENLRPRVQQGRLLYRLWQDLGTLVPKEELALGCFGHAGNDECHAIRALVCRLRHQLIDTRATILSYPKVPAGGYTLIENDEGI